MLQLDESGFLVSFLPYAFNREIETDRQREIESESESESERER